MPATAKLVTDMPMITCQNDFLAAKRRSTARKRGGGTCSTSTSSDMPRGGSRVVSRASSATATPRTPTMKNISRQEYFSARRPATTGPTRAPMPIFPDRIARAVPRFWAG